MRHHALGFALALLASSTLGCGAFGGSGGGKKTDDSSTASTAATASQATTAFLPGPAAGATSASALSPNLSTVEFRDVRKVGTVSEGNEIHLTFDQAMDQVPSYADPAKELKLPVDGDTFGVGAKLANDNLDAHVIVVTLGTAPHLRVNGTYDDAHTKAGSPSGIAVSDKGTGALALATDHTPAKAGKALDVTGVAVGTFKQTESMYFARGLHTADLLDDGRVLVVGGRGRDVYIPEVEMFDPLANTWSRADLLAGDKGYMKHGSMIVKRTQHATTKLKDGRILVTGGYGVKRKGWLGLYGEKEEVLDVAHIFDPKTNTFTEIGAMKHARRSHQATLMEDGRVLITGGYDESFWTLYKTTPDAEIYNPATNKFESCASMVEKRMYHTATPLDHGRKIVCIGGEKWDGGFRIFGKLPKLNAAIGGDVWANNSFTRSADLLFDRRNHRAIELTSGEVLVAGGDDAQHALTQIERLDPKTFKFTAAGDLRTARTNPAICRSGNEILIGGGMGFTSQGGKELGDVEIFNETTGLVTGAIKMLEARNSTAMVELQDGRVLLIGGMTGGSKDLLSLDGRSLQSCEILERP